MLNTKVLKLEDDIVDTINKSGVPPTVVSLILERIQHEATMAIKQVLQQEREVEQSKQQTVEQAVTPATPPVEIVQGDNIKDMVDVNLNK